MCQQTHCAGCGRSIKSCQLVNGLCAACREQKVHQQHTHTPVVNYVTSDYLSVELPKITNNNVYHTIPISG